MEWIAIIGVCGLVLMAFNNLAKSAEALKLILQQVENQRDDVRTHSESVIAELAVVSSELRELRVIAEEYRERFMPYQSDLDIFEAEFSSRKQGATE